MRNHNVQLAVMVIKDNLQKKKHNNSTQIYVCERINNDQLRALRAIANKFWYKSLCCH